MMRAPSWWKVCFGVVVLGAVCSSPLPGPRPTYDARLTSLELAIIKCIVKTVPGVTKGGGGSYDWSVTHSKSQELQGAEIEVVQVGQRNPDFTRRSEDSASHGYPNDWNIVRSVSSQLAATDDDTIDTRAGEREGLSDDWAIVRSISTELHLDVEQAPSDTYIESAAVEQKGKHGFQVSEEVVNQPISSVDDTSGDVGDDSFDIRRKSSELPTENGKNTHQTISQAEEYLSIANVGVGTSEYQHSFGNEYDGFSHQSPGDLNNVRSETEWSIVRSISSEQDPIEETSSTGSRQTTTSSENQSEKEDDVSYNVVPPISTELQPADNEAGEIPASLTELFPPSEEQTGSSWNSQAEDVARVSEVHSSDTDTLQGKEPCETGHRRIKNICRKVYTFQLKSHVR